MTASGNQGIFFMPYRITTYDMDRFRELRPSAILRIQQEVSEQHLDSVGYSYTRLFDKLGVFFAVTRMNTRIYASPAMNENIEVRTWSAGLRGVQFLRCFQLLGSGGNLLTESMAVYALMDCETRRPLRPDKIDLLDHIPTVTHRIAPDFPQKIRFPEDAPDIGEIPVRYSALDYNGHMNNTVYPDLLTDLVPGGMNDKTLSGFTLQYQSEALEGDLLRLRCVKEDNAYLFECRHERGICFLARAEFAPRIN